MGFGVEEDGIFNKYEGIIYKLLSRIFEFKDKLYSCPRH